MRRQEYFYVGSRTIPPRNMYYPAGVAIMLEELMVESTRSGAASLTAYLLQEVSFDEGATYLTVPFDCPEGLAFDELHSLPFYDSQCEVYDPSLLREISLVDEANVAMKASAETYGWSIVTEEGKIADPPVPLIVEPPNFLVHGVSYRYANREFDEEVFWSVLTSPIPRFRILTCVETTEEFDADWLRKAAIGTQCLALSIFDYCGYLLWFRNS